MRLIHFWAYRSSLKLHALRIQGPPSASACDANNPCETHVHQQRRLFLVCEEPDKLDRAFTAPTDYTDFLRTSELFVARQPLDSVPKRPRGECGDFNRVVTLEALLGPQLQAKAGIVRSEERRVGKAWKPGE